MEAHLYSSFYAEGLIGSAHSFCWWHSSSNLSDQICHHRRHHIVAYADIHVTLAKKQKVCSILSRVLSMNILRNKFCSCRVLVFWGFNLVFFRSSLHTPQKVGFVVDPLFIYPVLKHRCMAISYLSEGSIFL